MANPTPTNETPRRERLLESALALFAERGYAGTSVKAIAERAGVSQGLLYVHFENKQDLLIALFERGMQDVQFTLESDVATVGVKRLGILLRRTFDLMQANRDFWRLFYTLRFQVSVAEALGPAIQLGTSTIREELARVCRDMNVPHPELEARLLFATIDGVCQHAVLEPDTYPFEDVFDVLLSKYQEVSS